MEEEIVKEGQCVALHWCAFLHEKSTPSLNEALVRSDFGFHTRVVQMDQLPDAVDAATHESHTRPDEARQLLKPHRIQQQQQHQ